jgi:hypothetical protein
MTLGLREQLTPLAVVLADTTDLPTRYSNLSSPDQSQVDLLLTRCVSPLALYYLRSLRDLASGDDELIQQLTVELQRFAVSDVIIHTNHLSVSGVRPAGLYVHRGVSIRPLTPRERGAWAELNLPTPSRRFLPNTDYLPFVIFPNFTPSTLIEVRTTRLINEQFDRSRLANRVALAFFLTGFDISSPGYITHFDMPAWTTMGRWHTSFPVSEKPNIITDEPLSPEQFERIVDLAYKMPDFSGTETTRREIVLFRVLRACGARAYDSTFLDLVIALEAALLAGTTIELSYKFSLYGALFLRNDFAPRETFERLKNIYEVRSKLVHGGRLKHEANFRANQDAPELAKAVTLKAIESGWPDSKLLDSLALELGQKTADRHAAT